MKKSRRQQLNKISQTPKKGRNARFVLHYFANRSCEEEKRSRCCDDYKMSIEVCDSKEQMNQHDSLYRARASRRVTVKNDSLVKDVGTFTAHDAHGLVHNGKAIQVIVGLSIPQVKKIPVGSSRAAGI